MRVCREKLPLPFLSSSFCYSWFSTMIPNKGIVIPLFALAQFLLTSLVTADDVALNLGFYTDGSCSTRSSINPNATLGLSICAATLGAISIYVPTFPCSGNNVNLLGFSDTGCKSSSGGFFCSQNCCAWEFGSFGSILLTCSASTNGLPGNIVSYTTISVGPLAADATSAPIAGDPTSAAFLPTGTSSSSGGTSTGTGSTGSSGGTDSGTSTSSSSSTGWDQFPIGAKVGIIVGAIVAVVIIALLIWVMIYKEKKHRFDRMVALQQQPPNMSGYVSPYPHQQQQQPGTSVHGPPSTITYLPKTAPPSAEPMNLNQHLQPMSPRYAPSRYPVTEIDWPQENNRPQHIGSELGHSAVASWVADTHTMTAHTTH